LTETGGSRRNSKGENIRRERHAKVFYDEVRNRKPMADANLIAKNTRWDVDKIEEIRQHVFVKSHNRDGGMKPFDPDYWQSQVWHRLTDGKNIRDTDLLFLNHESLELTIMKEKGYSYERAHEIASKTYDWWSAVVESGEIDEWGKD